jgi:hypothetical protein
VQSNFLFPQQWNVGPKKITQAYWMVGDGPHERDSIFINSTITKKKNDKEYRKNREKEKSEIDRSSKGCHPKLHLEFEFFLICYLVDTV